MPINSVWHWYSCNNHQYICIHHTNRQTENRFSSCSILNLKTLFKFVSQCNLVPFFESRLCNVGNELDNCDFAELYSQVTDLFGNVIVKRINMRVFDLLARFHYILNLPRTNRHLSVHVGYNTNLSSI